MNQRSQKSGKGNKPTGQVGPSQLPPNIFTPPQQPSFTVQHTQQVRTIFDPDVLRQYQTMVPDAPERVLRVFEQNAATERSVRDRALTAQVADNRRRDWMAFLIIMGGLIAAVAFAWLGKPGLSGSTLLGLAGYAAWGFLVRKGKPPSNPAK